MQKDNITDYLYMTMLPVLLDGKKRAGEIALEMYMRHGITPHWFGRGMDIRLAFCAERHPLPATPGILSDEILTEILLDFAEEHGGLLVLYPCSPAAEAFIARTSAALESQYVIQPLGEGDPLAPLVRNID